MNVDHVMVFVCVIIISVLAIWLMVFVIAGQDKMMRRFNQLEDDIQDQLALSKRTLDASSQMIEEATRLANQRRG